MSLTDLHKHNYKVMEGFGIPVKSNVDLIKAELEELGKMSTHSNIDNEDITQTQGPIG